MVVVADSYGEKLAKIPMQDDNGDDGCEQEEAVSCKDGCEYDCCEHKHLEETEKRISNKVEKYIINLTIFSNLKKEIRSI